MIVAFTAKKQEARMQCKSKLPCWVYSIRFTRQNEAVAAAIMTVSILLNIVTAVHAICQSLYQNFDWLSTLVVLFGRLHILLWQCSPQILLL